MTTIKIDSKTNRRFTKESATLQRSLKKSLGNLIYKLDSEGNEPNKIYNNESIVYDRINDHIYIFKAHGTNNLQLRIVYGYEKMKKDSTLYFIDYAVKKKNNKKYLAEMNDKFKNTNISDLEFEELECIV